MSERLIDARGSFCPGLLKELISTLKMMQVGDVLEPLSTDKGSADDMPERVKKVGHEMAGTSQDTDGVWHMKVKKMN